MWAVVRALLRGIASIACLVTPVAADDFYKDKSITIFIGSGVGGGFDTYARTVAQFLGSHIPGNPTIKPVNRPGAAGRSNANLLYVRDPKDGTAIGLLGPWLVTEPLFQVAGVEFDVTKFNWLISTARDVSTCMFWKRSGIASLDDLLKKGEATVGSSGPSSVGSSDALLLNTVIGTKLKVIQGFKGTNEGFLAAERGELDGMCGMWISSVTSRYMAPLNSGDAQVILQLGRWRHPLFPKAVHVFDDLKHSKENLQAMTLVLAQLDMARPFVAPPGVPAERVALLKSAFEKLVKDPAFLAEAQKRALEVEPVSGDQIQKMIAEMYATPAPVVDRVKAIMGY